MKDNKKADTFRNEGNSKFRHRKFYEALIAYNKSLCHAENNSDNLGLAFANRSVVYFEMKQADKCIENIELARAHNYQNEARLQERQQKAEKLKQTQREDPENDPANFFKLSYPPNKKIPPFADCLEIRQNAQFGRHIITTRALKPGDIVAIEEPAFKCLYETGRYSRCLNCLKMNMLNLIPCDQNCTSGKLFMCLSVKNNKFVFSSNVLRSKLYDRRTQAISWRRVQNRRCYL
jgi:SET and MYND domain-containing protein 4